jgi:hypothetical protein
MNIIATIKRLRRGYIVGQRTRNNAGWVPETKMDPDDLIALAERHERLLAAAIRVRDAENAVAWAELETAIEECEQQ